MKQYLKQLQKSYVFKINLNMTMILKIQKMKSSNIPMMKNPNQKY